MKKLSPPAVFITRQTTENELAMARTERMTEAMNPGSVEVVTDEQLNDIVLERGWRHTPRWGVIREPQDPDVVFTLGRFGESEEERRARRERLPNLAAHDLYGYHTHWFRPDGEAWWRADRKGIVCQSAWQLHSIQGCPLRCAYCNLGGLVRVLVNIEDYCERLDEILALAPEQRLYKWDNQSDVSCFEPEYGASRILVEEFARRPGKFLEIYVGKSDNVDDLLEVDPQGSTILQWSVGGRTQSTVFEPETAPWDARIEAARRCQEAGYIVRFRFSPIIPVRDWREENAALIELIFERTRPDVISLCSFGWMDVDAARDCLDFSLLDPDFVAAMEAAAPFLHERGYTGGGRPIPHDARWVMFDFLINEIQARSPQTPIALCLETEEMWKALGPRIGQRPQHYVCNCGPDCAPGAPLYDRMTAGQR